MIAAVDLVNGLGVLAGLRRISVPGATGYLDTNFRGKADHGLRALEARDFVLLHVAAADDAGHLGSAQKKIEAVERLDAETVAPLLEGLRAMGGEWRLLVMSAHATPWATRRHSADPVPFLVYVSRDEGKPRGISRGYSERDAREQGIFIPEAYTLMERLLRR